MIGTRDSAANNLSVVQKPSSSGKRMSACNHQIDVNLEMNALTSSISMTEYSETDLGTEVESLTLTFLVTDDEKKAFNGEPFAPLLLT
jgi:hypothetical protein